MPDNKELPTAAIVEADVFKPNLNAPHETVELLNAKITGLEVEEGDELVRRADVKELIEERIEEVEEKLEEESGFDRLNRNDLKARKDELQNLKEVFGDG